MLLGFLLRIVWWQFSDWGTYEARVQSCGGPACYGGRVALIVVVEVPAWVEFSAGLDQVDETMSGCSREELDKRAESGQAGQCSMHDCGDQVVFGIDRELSGFEQE